MNTRQTNPQAPLGFFLFITGKRDFTPIINVVGCCTEQLLSMPAMTSPEQLSWETGARGPPACLVSHRVRGNMCIWHGTGTDCTSETLSAQWTVHQHGCAGYILVQPLLCDLNRVMPAHCVLTLRDLWLMLHKPHVLSKLSKQPWQKTQMRTDASILNEGAVQYTACARTSRPKLFQPVFKNIFLP